MSLRINRRNSFLEIKEGGSVKIFKDAPRHLRRQIPESSFPYQLGYCGDRHYGLYSEPSFHLNQNSELLTSSAVKLDGTQFLETNEISLTGLNEFSISSWVKTESNQEEVLITDINSEGSGCFSVKTNNAQNRPEFSMYNGVNNFVSVTGQNLINDGNWHLINVNFNCDESSKEATIDLYIDSVLQDSQTINAILDSSLLQSTESFNSAKNNIQNITDENYNTYIELGGNTQVSNIYFGEPITEGIDKIRIRAIPDQGTYATTSYSLLLRHKETQEITTETFLSFAGGKWKRDTAASTRGGHSYNHIPYPAPIPESGISYGPETPVYQFGCPSCTTIDNINKVWFPAQEYNITNPYGVRSYPVSESSARDYETNVDGDTIIHPTQYVYASFNTWQTEAPFLYGKDFSLSQFSEYDIVGFQHNLSDSVGHVNFSRIIELSLYKDNVKKDLFTIPPLDNFAGSMSNTDKLNPITVGSSSSDNKNLFFNGCIDQLIISEKIIPENKINESYAGRDSKEYYKEKADEMGVIAWYDFSNSEVIGWDKHYKKSSHDLVRLYSFNNTRKDSSAHNIMPEEFGNVTYSSEFIKFFDKSAFFNGETYLFDPGGRELSLDNNFTIDCFVNFSSIPDENQQNIIRTAEYKKTGVSYNIYFKNDRLYFDIYLGIKKFASIESNKLDISINQFYHLAICRENNNINMFFNQTSCAQVSLPYYLPLQNGSEGLYLFQEFNGYVQDLRIMANTSLYNADHPIDNYTERLTGDFYDRNILTTTSTEPLLEEVAFSNSQGILLPQNHSLVNSQAHKAFNFHKNSFSIFSWIRLENINKSGILLGSWNDEGGTSHSYAVRYVSNFRGQVNTLVFLASEDGTNWRAVRTAKLKNNIIRPKRWYFFGVSYNSENKDLDFYIYDEIELIDSTKISVNQFYTISRRDDFKINGVRNTEYNNTSLDMSIGQLFFLYKYSTASDVADFWNYGGGLKYESSREINRDVIAWFDFEKGSLLDLNGTNHLFPQTNFTITEGRKKLESIGDESEIFLAKTQIQNNILFNLTGNRPTYESQGINNLPSIQFEKSNLSFLDSNYYLDFTTSFKLYFCFKTNLGNNNFAPIIDFSNSPTEGLSILWKDTPSANHPGELKLLINNQELLFSNEDFIKDTNVVTLEWDRNKEKIFLTVNNSRLSSAERCLSGADLHLNFAPAPLSLGRFYYDHNSSLETFNGLLSEIILDKGIFEAGIQNFLACKYNTPNPGYSPDYIFDDDIPAIIFDTSEVRETIGKNSTYLGKIKCSLANPIYSIVDDNSFTISESGDIHLTDPADIEDIFYTFTILVEDEDSDKSATISFITYVQEDTIIVTLDTSNLKSFLTIEDAQAGLDIGCVYADGEPVTWSMSDPLFSIDANGCVTLSNSIPSDSSSLNFTVLATDNQDNVTAASHNIRIVDQKNISELEFINADNASINLEFTVDRDQEFIQIDEGSGFQTLDTVNMQFLSSSSSILQAGLNQNLNYYSYINPVNHYSTSASYIDYHENIAHVNQTSSSRPIYVLNNSLTAPDPYLNSSSITNPDLMPALKVIESLVHNTDGNRYNTTPPNGAAYYPKKYSINISSPHVKIRGKFLHLSIKSNVSNPGSSTVNSGSIKITANSESWLQKLSFNNLHFNKLILNCETEQLIDLDNFCDNARFEVIEKTNFYTTNVLTAFEAFKDSYVNDSCKTFLSSLSFDNLINATSFFENCNVTGSAYLDLSSWNTWNLLLMDKMFQGAYIENNLLSFKSRFWEIVNSFNFPNYTNSDINTNTLLPNPSYVSAFTNTLGSTFYTRKVRSANYLFRNYTVSLKSKNQLHFGASYPSSTSERSYLDADVSIYEGSIIDTESINFLNDTDLQNTVLDLSCLELPICSEFLQAFKQINVEKILLQNLDFKFKTNLRELFAYSPGLKSINLCNYGDIESRVDESPANFFAQHKSIAFSLSEMFRGCSRLENLDIKFEQGSGAAILASSGNEQYSEFYRSLGKPFMDSLSFLSFPKCIDASKMFLDCHLITHISVPRFKNITTLSQFAQNCYSLTNFQGFEKHFEEDLDTITASLTLSAAPTTNHSTDCNIELRYDQINNSNLFPEYIIGAGFGDSYIDGIFKKVLPEDEVTEYDSAGEIVTQNSGPYGSFAYFKVVGNPADYAEPGADKVIIEGVCVEIGTAFFPDFENTNSDALLLGWNLNNVGLGYDCPNILSSHAPSNYSGSSNTISSMVGSNGTMTSYTPTATPSIVVNGASIPIYPEGTSGSSLSSQLISHNFFSQTCSTLNLKTIQLIFNNCNSLKELNLEGLITANVIDMSNAFSSCYHLRHINVCDSGSQNDYTDPTKGSFNSSNCTDFSAMFNSSSMIRTFGSIRGTFNSAAFNFNNAESMSSMFSQTFRNVALDFLTSDSYLKQQLNIELNSAEKIKGVLDAHLGFDSQELFDDFDISSAADASSPHTEPQYTNPDSELIASAINPEFQIYPNGGHNDNYGENNGAIHNPQNLAISDDGNTLFFLGKNRKINEDSSSTGYTYGMVYVFRRKSDGTFEPNAFESPNEIITNLPIMNIGSFGASYSPWDRLDVNASGNVLIVSSPQYPVNDASDRKGAALIFRYNESTSSWGDYTLIQGPHGAISKGGHDISIDDAGDTFIMSSRSSQYFGSIYYAAIFKYDSSTENWNQMNIEGEGSSNPLIRQSLNSADPGSNFYPRLSEMSGDGNLVVVGGITTYGTFRTYIYDSASSMWKQRGTSFSVGSQLSNESRYSPRMRLSKDGNTLIIVKPRHATSTNDNEEFNDVINIFKNSPSTSDWGSPFKINLPPSPHPGLSQNGGLDAGIVGDGSRIFVSSLSKISIYDFNPSLDSWSLTGAISSNGLKTADGSPDSTGFDKNFVVTPDGSKLFTGSNGKSIVMYDVATSLSGETISDAFQWEDYRDYLTNGLDKISKNFILNFTDRTSNEPINMQSLFSMCNMLPHITILGNPNSIKVNNFQGAFADCTALKDFLDLSALNFKECSSLSSSFINCLYLKRIILPPSFLEANNSTLDTSSTFENCHYLQDFPNGTSSWSGTSVVDMHSMFQRCHLIKNLDLSSFNPSLCENMSSLFSECYSFEILNLENFNTESCKNFSRMFYKVGKPPNLDLSVKEDCEQTNRSTILIDEYATGYDGVIYDYDRRGINASVFVDLQSILDLSNVDSATYLLFIANNLTPQVRYYLHYRKEFEEFVQIWKFSTSSPPSIISGNNTILEGSVISDGISRAAPGLASIDLTSFDLQSAVDSLDPGYWSFIFGSDVSQFSNARPNIRAVINPEDSQGRHHFFKLGSNNVISGINLNASLDLLKASDPPPDNFTSASANITFPQSIGFMFSGISIDTLTIPANFFINHKERIYRYLDANNLSHIENPTNDQRVTIGASPNPSYMFYFARINKLNISDNFLESLKYSTSFGHMFDRATARDYRKVSLINPSNSTPNTEYENLEELISVNFSDQDAPIDTAGTDFGELDTTNAISMDYMFSNAHFTNFDTSKIKTDNVINMNYLFNGFDTSLNDLIINSMNTKNVFYMRGTFSYILNKKYTFNNEPLSEVDLSGLDLSSCVNMREIFQYSDIDAFILPENRMLFPAENSNQLIFINFNGFQRSVNSFNHQKNLQPRINKINTFLSNIAKSGLRHTDQYDSRINNAEDLLSSIDKSSVLSNIYTSRKAYAIHENPLDFYADSEMAAIGDSITIWQDISSAALTIDFHNLDLFPTNIQKHSAVYFFQGNIYISSIVNLSILDFDIRDYTSSSASDFDFRNAFQDNSSLALDLSSWCVNSISSAPSKFADSSPHIISPNWGANC